MPDIVRSLLLALNADGPTIPEWIELIPVPDEDGLIQGRDGRVFRLGNPQAVVVAFEAKRRAMVVDYEHSTEVRAPEGLEAPGAGWVTEIRVTAAGAIEGRVQWTDRAKAYILAREYRFISPVLLYDKHTLEIAEVISAGLTNRQNLFNRALNKETGSTQTNHTMNKEQMQALCRELGIDESSTAEQIQAAATKLATAKRKADSDLQVATNRAEHPSLEKFVPRADYDNALTRANNAERELQTIKSTTQETAINAEIDAALKAGKITPATKDYYVAMCKQDGGLESFKKFVEAAPVIGDPSGLDGKTAPGSQSKALNSEETAVARLMGVDPEAFAKTKAAEAQ